MAQRRMVSPKIIDTDEFMEMPSSSQALYFHMLLRADDDGFLANPKRLMKLVGAAEDDFKVLVAKRFVVVFDTGVCVIRHWLVHNLIRSDRYHETMYTEEKASLSVDKNGVYDNDNQMATNRIPNAAKRVPEVRLGKVSLGEGREGPAKPDPIPYSEIIDHLNTRCETSYRAGTRITKEKIAARWAEGFRAPDFKMVIDWKVERWAKDPKMYAYLRPETLFGPKFESYLNEIPPAIRRDMEVDYVAT